MLAKVSHPMRYFTEPAADDPNPRHPCGTCGKNVSQRFKAIKCDACGYWNHIRCDGISSYTYEKILELPQAEREKMIHFCKICKEDSLPFQKLSDEEFITSIIKNIEYKEDLNLHTCPPEHGFSPPLYKRGEWKILVLFIKGGLLLSE